MSPPPADVGYQFGPGYTGFVFGYLFTAHIEVRQHVPPVHPLGAQIPSGTPGEQLLDRAITVHMAQTVAPAGAQTRDIPHRRVKVVLDQWV